MIWWVSLVNGFVYDSSGRVLTVSASGSLLWSYGYDGAGRLTSAVGSGHSYGYDFTSVVSGCPTGANAYAGKNTNRGRLVDSGVTVSSYCYDMADRQIAASGIGYDAHQNQVLHDGDTYRYDQADRHLATVVSGVRQVALTRDALDRVVARTDTDLATGAVSTTRYGFAGGGDVVSGVYDTSNNLLETTVALAGGVLYTKRSGGTDVWSYPNVHGDIAATRVNSTVTMFNWDPYGNPVGNIPDNSAGSSDWGWLGQHQRTLDHATGLNPIIEMGARVYQPDTGRFQQTDPIEDGTTTNPYSYVPDPINQYDLNGMACGVFSFVCDPVASVAKGSYRFAVEHRSQLAAFGALAVCAAPALGLVGCAGAQAAAYAVRVQQRGYRHFKTNAVDLTLTVGSVGLLGGPLTALKGSPAITRSLVKAGTSWALSAVRFVGCHASSAPPEVC